MGFRTKKAITITALAVVFSLACGHSPRTTTPQEANAPFILRPVGIESRAFVQAADALIEQKAPEFRDHDAEVLLGMGLLNKYGITDRNSEGKLYIVLGRPALMLATVEDLAMVLLHEYVHVVYWDEVFKPSFGGATNECKKARAEMIANKVTVEMYRAVGYRRSMLLHGIAMYNQAYTYARVMECPLEITIDLPSYVRPRNFKGTLPRVPPIEEDPDFVTDGRKEKEHLNPWDDPNKTDPLYPSYQQKPIEPSDAP